MHCEVAQISSIWLKAEGIQVAEAKASVDLSDVQCIVFCAFHFATTARSSIRKSSSFEMPQAKKGKANFFLLHIR